MSSSLHRKTVLIFALALTLALALGAFVLRVTSDEVLLDRLGISYYVLGLSIIACVLMLLAGYVWDRTMVKNVQTLQNTVTEVAKDRLPQTSEDPDDIIRMARGIERMARDLQQTEANYRAIVEDQTDMICRFAPDGSLTFLNGAFERTMGRKRSDLLGTRFPGKIPPADDRSGRWTDERKYTDERGNRRIVAWTIRPVLDRREQITEFQAVGHDITARKEAEAALIRAKETAEAADRIRSEFLASVSHEIRTPINGVMGFADLLSNSNLDSEQRQHVALIQLSAAALEKLVTSLQELSRLEAGRFSISSRPFQLRALIEGTMSELSGRAAASGLKLQVEIDPSLPAEIISDDACLRRILTQVVGNSLKFTEQGSISVHVSSQGDGPKRTLQLRVQDTGIGIAPEELPKIFRPFSRVRERAPQRGVGLGLGLVTARKICESLGGTMVVKSDPGQGTVIEFTIGYDVT